MRLHSAVSTFTLDPRQTRGDRGPVPMAGAYNAPRRAVPERRGTILGTTEPMPMPLSMTGFARRESRSELGALAWELRTVNHRYLEASLRLPEEFRPLEPELREALAKRVTRGKLEASLRHEPAAGGRGALAVDAALAREVAAAAAEVGRSTGLSAMPTVMDVLRWPGVATAAASDPAPLHSAARALLLATLDDLVANRQREGAKLAAAIAERAGAVRTQVAVLRAAAPALVAALRERLRARVAELGATLDPQRLEQEVVLLAAKADVAEELDRLDAHCAELDRALAERGPVGRKLDFLMQEFNREANTLGSKAADPATTRAAVELKVLIEQMREQIQNIE
jgi:uncharacterized protein (TIGR00255 family)